MRHAAPLVAPATFAAVLAISACASESSTADRTTAPSSLAANTSTTLTPHVVVGSLGRESIASVQACLAALVDDAGAPGKKFVDKVRKLSVGYTLVEPLAAAQSVCAAATHQLEAESPEPASSAETLLAATNDLNAALELATEQIRTDAFYRNESVPAQFIPEGAAALQRSIADFYGRASFILTAVPN
jgi:hypothetical protein